MTKVNSFILLFSNLIGQNHDISSIINRSFYNNSRKTNSTIFFHLFVNWLISSLILSKAFTCLLLDSFFYTKVIPIVRTLQDIQENKQLLIGGDYHSLSILTNIVKFDIKDLLARMNENKYPSSNIRKMIELIINGKGVVLFNTFIRRTFIDLAKFYNDKIYISDHKYLPDYTSFLVYKEQQSSKIIEF